MRITDHIARFAASPLGRWADVPPWAITSVSHAILAELVADLRPRADFTFQGDIAIHRKATVEHGAVLKGPAVISAGCFVAAGAYVRDGCWLDEDCILGPGAELKSSFMFRGSKLAHFNFVGDSVLGEGVNIEAGAIIANYRNEKADKRIRFSFQGRTVDTGVEKFGALAGDGVRLGANAVVAPGAVLTKGTIVPRLSLIDQA